MDLRDIKAIIDLMKKNSISEFELERQDFKIKLKRGGPGPNGGAGSSFEIPVPTYPQPIPQHLPGAALGSQTSIPADEPKSNDLEVKSPMIGTLYLAASPEAANYVEVGVEVNPDTVVCIIEAMKVMNEIKAEVRGVITHVLIENGKPVEFGQPLFKVRPA